MDACWFLITADGSYMRMTDRTLMPPLADLYMEFTALTNAAFDTAQWIMKHNPGRRVDAFLHCLEPEKKVQRARPAYRARVWNRRHDVI